jgi:hypothetical protein
VSDVNVLLDSVHSAPALGPVAQDHLFQARQMQALSFTFHIPLLAAIPLGLAATAPGLLEDEAIVRKKRIQPKERT